ncbi:hypothetical protein OESDEN_23582 [Oesophagostomum dentatum]|uniref:Uncharacterized protein n=1 Tax=Oesophagostomum dentatum TaxID=61180 RepID=A0A0B1RUP2_OESDE|nr:hypothetical protein OESDEN_23582 [Oesophagostomum dentatum]
MRRNSIWMAAMLPRPFFRKSKASRNTASSKTTQEFT